MPSALQCHRERTFELGLAAAVGGLVLLLASAVPGASGRLVHHSVLSLDLLSRLQLLAGRP